MSAKSLYLESAPESPVDNKTMVSELYQTHSHHTSSHHTSSHHTSSHHKSSDKLNDVYSPALVEEEEVVGPRPDSLRGWIVVLGAFFQLMLVIGSTNSFGVYMQEYQLNVFPTTPASTITWIGSLQFGAMCFFGVGAGVLVERFDARLVVCLGCVVNGGSLLIASACRSPIALLFTQGLLFGVGGSCVMIPGISLPSQWMSQYRALATGVTVAGGSIGGLWLSFATRAMVAKVGWPWALRITGLLTIAVGIATSPLMRLRVPVPKRARIIDFAALRNVRFVLLFFSSLFAAGGYYAPYYYMPSYAVVVLEKPAEWGANISSILNAGSIAGRIFMGLTADYIGPLNALLLSSFISGISVLVLWLPFKSLPVLVVSAVLFGFFSGSLVSLVPVVTANLFGVHRLSSILGLLLISYTIGSFVCSPVAGAILDKYGHGTDYTWSIVYAGLFFCMATVVLVALRMSILRTIFQQI